jgi:hypothetical protein
MIARPDEEPNISAARRDWNRLRDRLKQGRLWLEVRELFGGDGAFLALPPKCVSDQLVATLSATVFNS